MNKRKRTRNYNEDFKVRFNCFKVMHIAKPVLALRKKKKTTTSTFNQG